MIAAPRSPGAFLLRFHALHLQARAADLPAALEKEYEDGRAELAALMVAAQHLIVPAGGTARSTFRVAHLTNVVIEQSSGPLSLSTIDIGEGGFAARLHPAPPVGTVVNVRLRMPGKEASGVSAQARVVRQGSGGRVEFAFTQIDPKDKKRLSMTVYDLVMAKLPGGH